MISCVLSPKLVAYSLHVLLENTLLSGAYRQHCSCKSGYKSSTCVSSVFEYQQFQLTTTLAIIETYR